MTLTEKDVRYVADLAHLELSDDELKRFQPQLAAILEYVQKLNQLDTANVEPMAQVIAGGLPDASLRSDQNHESLPQEAALANAPEAGAGCFKVPSVIERE
ncbi:MAG: Asp-tRNA(Asn)/Glu-tRNA(Gln) amidotransferase subunit GatC [Terriglobia bacterium]